MEHKDIDFEEQDSLDELLNELEQDESVRAEVDPKTEVRNDNLEQTPKKKKQEKLPWQKNLLLYMHDLVYLLAIVVVVFLLLFRVVVVSGTSMNNTLMNGDYLLLVGDIFYRQPKQGDVIVASKKTFENGAPIVKRVIATEGQWVDIDFKSGIVYVDNVALDEPYTLTPTTTPEGVKFPLQVKEGCVFVMGDNRNDSKDSRDPDIGLIDRREILGKVLFLFFPGDNYNRVERDFGRIGVVS